MSASSIESFSATLIAPCGMNCGLCIGLLREKNRCPGCNGDDAAKKKSCLGCRIKNCDQMETGRQKFCFECARFPCARLRQLDKRYRQNYGMSMIDNLVDIREIGLEGFLLREKERWTCPDCGGAICVHREACITCGRTRGRGCAAQGDCD